MALVGALSASAGNSVIQVSGSIEVLTGHTIAVEGGGDPGLYTAGDGLDLTGTAFSTDLKSSGGLKIDSTELAVEPSDFAGTGLEDDGSDNLRISTAAAGTGLQGGGGSALSIGAGTGIDIGSTTVGIDNTIVATLSGSQFSSNVGITGSLGVTTGLSGSLTTLTDGRPLLLPGNADIAITSGSGDQITITVNNTTYSAGDGLDLSGTTFLVDLKSSGGLKIDSTELAVEPSDFAGTGLEDDGSDNLRIAASAAGTGLSGGAGSALSIDNSVVATLTGSQFSGNMGVTGSISATGALSGSQVQVTGVISGSHVEVTGSVSADKGTFTSDLSGSLQALADGTAYLRPGNVNITITSASAGYVSISSTDTNTTYTAGNGLDLSGTVFSTDLKTGSGLIIDTTELSIDHAIIPATSGAIFSGDVGITGSLYTTGHAEVGALEVGGGFGSTGVTITGAGAINMNSSIKVGGGAIQDSAGNNNILISGGNTTISGDLTANTGIKISSNAITASDGGKPIIWDTSDNVTIAGDLTVTGNNIDGSAGTVITFSTLETQLAGDLKIGGNDIKDSAGNVMLSFDASGNIDGIGEIESDVVIKSATTSDVPKLHIESLDSSANDAGEINFERYDDSILSVGESIGEIRFSASETNDGSYYIASAIEGKIGAGTWTDSSSQPGRLSFYTVPTGGTSLVEQMMIDSDGLVTLTGDLAIGGSINKTGNLTLDVSGDITLDAAGGQIFFYYGGVEAVQFDVDATPIVTFTGNTKIDSTGTLELECTGDMTIDASGDIVMDVGGGTSNVLRINADEGTPYGICSIKAKGDTIADGLAVYGDTSTSSTRLWTDASGLRHISGGSGDNGTIYVNDSGGDLVVGDDVYIKGTSSSNQTDLRINTTSGLVYHYTSTRKVKNLIVNNTAGLAEILQLQPVTYERKSDPGVPEIGLIAEDVRSALGDDYVILGPDFAYDENGDYTWREIPAETEGNPPKREKILDSDETVPHDWDYRSVITVLIGSVKDLKEENDALLARIVALESQ